MTIITRGTTHAADEVRDILHGVDLSKSKNVEECSKKIHDKLFQRMHYEGVKEWAGEPRRRAHLQAKTARLKRRKKHNRESKGNPYRHILWVERKKVHPFTGETLPERREFQMHATKGLREYRI